MADSRLTLKIFKDENEVSKNLAKFVIISAGKAIADRGIFTVGLSGGSAAKYLSEQLPKLETDWTKWRVFFCDERHVPYDDPECTFKFYKTNLFSKVPIPENCIFPDDPSISVEDAASLYAEKLRSVFGSKKDFPEFDLLLLGMGPDGHTCSLFPGHSLLQEQRLWVAAISDSPKPPPERITFTFSVLLAARKAVFVACGEGKAIMVKRVVEGTDDPPLPAARVRPRRGSLVWFLDEDAAHLLKKD